MPRRRALRRVRPEEEVVEVGQLRRRRGRRVGMREVWRIVRQMGGRRKRLGLVLVRRGSEFRLFRGKCEVEEAELGEVAGNVWL